MLGLTSVSYIEGQRPLAVIDTTLEKVAPSRISPGDRRADEPGRLDGEPRRTGTIADAAHDEATSSP
jgi:hypothetical protein